MTTAEYTRERERIISTLIERRKFYGKSMLDVAHEIVDRYYPNCDSGERSRRVFYWHRRLQRWEHGDYNPRFSSFLKWSEALRLRVTFEEMDDKEIDIPF